MHHVCQCLIYTSTRNYSFIAVQRPEMGMAIVMWTKGGYTVFCVCPRQQDVMGVCVANITNPAVVDRLWVSCSFQFPDIMAVNSQRRRAITLNQRPLPWRGDNYCYVSLQLIKLITLLVDSFSNIIFVFF